LKCKNCSVDIDEGKEFCDSLCKYGFARKQYESMNGSFMKTLKEYDLE